MVAVFCIISLAGGTHGCCVTAGATMCIYYATYDISVHTARAATPLSSPRVLLPFLMGCLAADSDEHRLMKGIIH